MSPEERDSALAAHYQTILSDNPILDAERVNQIFLDCLLRPDEFDAASNTPHDPDAVIMVEGVIAKFGLHVGRLEGHRNEIAVMVDQVAPSFFVGNNSGGDSFLNLCVDKFGRQWGEHRTMEQFVALAMATGYVVYNAPRIAWKIFPGGMPYLAFRHEPLDRVAINAWVEKLDLITKDFEAGQAGDTERATNGIKMLTAMMEGLR